MLFSTVTFKKTVLFNLAWLLEVSVVMVVVLMKKSLNIEEMFALYHLKIIVLSNAIIP